MTTPIIDLAARQFALNGYIGNLSNREIKGDARAISVGRAAALALELGQTALLQSTWQEVPVVVGMPTLAQFRAGYEKNVANFVAFETGEGKAFTAPGTPFSNAVGCYARALYLAANTKSRAGEDSPEFWAGSWGVQALTAAGFPEQGMALNKAIVDGVALPTVKSIVR